MASKIGEIAANEASEAGALNDERPEGGIVGKNGRWKEESMNTERQEISNF
jgi:hypothetical protein